MSTTAKKDRRLRRAVKTRQHIRVLGVARLSVHRTPQHIYAQLTDASGSKVLAAASTLQEAVSKDLKNGGNVEAAKAVGRAIAERAKAAGVTKVAFDRSGFQYHGRVKALAEAAREAGLEF
ncbi:MAG TPA: 50S ribosomal protein L18 [Steroidobacteraceae bacterium]|nr:50S ribosomal protein L18 [Steroidobacteraceae bacterium]